MRSLCFGFDEMRKLALVLMALQAIVPATVSSQVPLPTPAPVLRNLLVDRNGDGAVRILAFGDSITSGVGDEEEKGGYPQRLEELLKVDVSNSGVPGEELCNGGIERFADSIVSSRADIVLMLEGFNDARMPCPDEYYQRLLQRAVNIAFALGKEPVIMTLMQPIANHFYLAPFTPGYSAIVREVAELNATPYVDLEHAWITTCRGIAECPLFNLPEGLHPTAEGYTAIAQAAAAVLLGIDLFAPDGPKRLGEAIGLPETSIIVKPDTLEDEAS